MRKAVFSALFLSSALVAIPAFAQVADAPPPADQVPAGEEILVVGTRAQGRTTSVPSVIEGCGKLNDGTSWFSSLLVSV